MKTLVKKTISSMLFVLMGFFSLPSKTVYADDVEQICEENQAHLYELRGEILPIYDSFNDALNKLGNAIQAVDDAKLDVKNNEILVKADQADVKQRQNEYNAAEQAVLDAAKTLNDALLYLEICSVDTIPNCADATTAANKALVDLRTAQGAVDPAATNLAFAKYLLELSEAKLNTANEKLTSAEATKNQWNDEVDRLYSSGLEKCDDARATKVAMSAAGCPNGPNFP